jgi:hypothetical protein
MHVLNCDVRWTPFFFFVFFCQSYQKYAGSEEISLRDELLAWRCLSYHDTPSRGFFFFFVPGNRVLCFIYVAVRHDCEGLFAIPMAF